jgi:YHS domain-containing protein
LPDDETHERYEMSGGRRIMKNATTTAVKDPVCGMDVDVVTAAGRTEYKGQEYFFCGTTCQEKFDAHPDQYMGASAKASKSGGCYS